MISQVHSKHRNAPNTKRLCMQGERNRPCRQATARRVTVRNREPAGAPRGASRGPRRRPRRGGGRRPPATGRPRVWAGPLGNPTAGWPRWARPRPLDLRATGPWILLRLYGRPTNRNRVGAASRRAPRWPDRSTGGDTKPYEGPTRHRAYQGGGGRRQMAWKWTKFNGTSVRSISGGQKERESGTMGYS